MNMRAFKYILCALLLFNCGCESFLNVKPDGEVVNDELLKDAEGFEDAIYGVYATMAGNSFYGRHLTFYLYDILAQYYYRNTTGTTDPDPKIMTYQYTHRDVREMIDQIWVGMYKNIGYVNNILINLKKFSNSSLPLYDVYKAECLGLRAFLHFELLRVYSESIVHNPSAEGIPYSVTYSYVVSPFLSAAETYEKIIGDLQEAEALLAAHGEYIEEPSNLSFLKDRQIHMNLYAIQAILARVYWTKGDMKEAADYALKVIDSGVFGLADKLEIEDLMNGVLAEKETIWGLFSDMFYTDVDNFLVHNTHLELKEHIDTYDADKEGVDFRLEKWFRDYSEPFVSGWRPIKIFDMHKYTATNHTNPRDMVSGLSIIRMPELYYIAAEYYLTVNDQTNAMKYVDKVLESRGLTPFADRTVTLTVDHMIRERKKEFICEGQFFHTLKRYNQDIREPRSGIIYKASKDIYVFPLPDDEIDYREE